MEDIAKKFFVEEVRKDGMQMQFITNHLRSRGLPPGCRTNFITEICLEAVKNNGLALYFIPREYLQPYEIHLMCVYAVKNNGAALAYVPMHYRNKMICRLAVKNNALSLYNVPDRHKTWDICLDALLSNPISIGAIPEKHLNEDVCLLAVRADGWALPRVPEKFRTFEVCQTALRESEILKQWVPVSILAEMEDAHRADFGPFGLNPHAREYIPVF
jgi:hypothetical protein